MLLDYPNREHVFIYSFVKSNLPIYLYIIPSIDSLINPQIHSSIYPTIHSSKYMFMYLCIYISMYLSIYVSIYLCIHLLIYLSIHLHVPGGDFVYDSHNHIEFQCDYKYKTSSENNVIIYLSISLSIYLSVCLSIYPYIYLS